MAEPNLKPGWQTYRFDQIAINVNERVEPGDTDLEHYVGLEHLDTDSLKIRRWGTPDDVEATKLRFHKGDIIFGRRRVYQRKLAVADFDGICSAHAMVLRPNPDVVLPELLPFFMQSDLFMNRALDISVGSLSPTINWRTLAAQEFPLPTPAEQRRLVEVFKAQETLLENLREAEATSQRLLRARIDNIVRSINTQPLGNAILQITSGSRGWARYYSDSGPWFLRAGNLTRHTIELDLTDLKRVNPPEGAERERTRARIGDVLVAITGEYLGKIGLITDDVPETYINQHLALVRLDLRNYEPGFVAHMLTSSVAQHEIWRRNDGGTKPGMTLSEVGALPIPVAEIERQRELLSLISEIKFSHDGINRRRKHLEKMRSVAINKLCGDFL